MPAVSQRGSSRRTINEINMVPFIDVMLVLLIIFMVTAPLITPSMIDLPSVGKASKQPDKIIQVVVGKDEALELKINDRSESITLEKLAATVKKDVKYESVVKVMDTLQRAGIMRVGLSVQLAP